MSREYDQDFSLTPIQIDREREERMRRFGSLLRIASGSPDKWVETTELLDPYLEFVRLRITGRIPDSESSVQDTNIEQTLPQDSLSQIYSLPDLLNVKETAAVLRISSITLKRWGKRGLLHPIRVNERGDRRFRKEDLIQFMQSRLET
ncbi:MAG: helix-turn-helix domain-containing protein [Candidatus Daviesbacteria bacterium]|nr:helix-turn-helix domain-containing protein [Candidatus Daviesbacteria bacterium]